MSSLAPVAGPESSTLVELASERAQRHPERVAFRYRNAEGEETVLTFGDLDVRASALAARLTEQGLTGERVLLLLPTGPDYVAAFFGCLYAGAVAVPVYPPQLNRHLERLETVLEDSGAAAALTHAAGRVGVERFEQRRGRPVAVRWLVMEDLLGLSEDDLAMGFSGPKVRPGDLAFLQYTSGSTAAPKGVRVSHRNLLHNQALIHRAFGTRVDDVVGSWLPLYHDMGLVGSMLHSLWAGVTCVLLSPVDFLRDPRRWLELISEHQVTISGAPNFAYDLCVRRITEEQRRGLDLSSWRVAFNGAETVRPETLAMFADAFADQGFRRRAFLPCYGLAEATLLVSAGPGDVGPRVRRFDATDLRRGRAVPAPALEAEGEADRSGVRELVSCGRPVTGWRALVVDPETSRPLPDGVVGELWLAGRSVAGGYWRRDSESQETFLAFTDGVGDGPFLRTGDLGFLAAGELYLTGRRKDLIVMRGRNHDPADLEATAATSHPVLMEGSGLHLGAAFAIDTVAGERPVVVQEVPREYRRFPQGVLEEIADALRRRVVEDHGLDLAAVALVRPGGVPRTSSGKVRRGATRDAFQEGTLAILHQWSPVPRPRSSARRTAASLDVEATVSHVGSVSAPLSAAVAPVQPIVPEELTSAGRWLRDQLTDLLDEDMNAVSLGSTAAGLGLDSLRAHQLQQRIAERFQLEISLAQLLELESLHLLVRRLEQGGTADEGSSRIQRTAEGLREHPLTFGQEALYFLHQLHSQSSAYNLVSALRLELPEPPAGRSLLGVLSSAVEDLVLRHRALRVSFQAPQGRPVQRVVPMPVATARRALSVVDGVGGEALSEHLDQLAREPFDLERGPLLRVRLLRPPAREAAMAGEVLALAVHHIAADLATLGQLMRELVLLVRHQLGAAELPAPPELEIFDIARWQRGWVESAEGQAQQRWWARYLEGAPPALELPLDRPRPARRSFAGAVLDAHLDEDTTAALEALGRQRGATLFMALEGLFQVAAARWCGRRDFVLGMLSSGRDARETAEVMGYMVNPLPLVAAVREEETLEDLLVRARWSVIDVLAHQAFPFPLMVERLRPPRDAARSPVFQVLFALQRASLPDAEAAAAAAVGQAAPSFSWEGMGLEFLPLAGTSAQFDLSLFAARGADGVRLRMEWATDLYDATTMRRFLAFFRRVVWVLTRQPRQPMGRLSAVPPAHRHQLVVEAADTRRRWPEAATTPLQWWEREARRRPTAVALYWGEPGSCQSISQRELLARVDGIARALRWHGAGPETVVAVALPRGPDLLPVLLAVWKAGAAFLPVELTPRRRLYAILENARPTVRVTSSDAAEAGWLTVAQLEREAAGLPPLPQPSLAATSLAYVLYTSGSTGRPKGVMGTHGALLNRLLWMQHTFPLGAADRVLQKTPVTFDVSLWELFWPAAVGASVVMAQPGEQRDPAALLRWVRREGISVLHFVPSLLPAFLDEVDRSAAGDLPLRWLVCSGEALPVALARRVALLLPRVGLANLYGPTEAAVDVTAHLLATPSGAGGGTRSLRPGRPASLPHATVPIGEPISNVRAVVLDTEGRPAPLGVPGHLHLGGVALARGYWDNPRLTAEVFVPDALGGDPLSRGEGASVHGVRLYATGDLVLRDVAGRLVFLRRLDQQVKVRGVRLELGEVEAALMEHPGVSAVVAALARSREGGAPGSSPSSPSLPEAPDSGVLHRAAEDRRGGVRRFRGGVAAEGPPRLTAWVEVSEGLPADHRPDAASLRAFLVARLPMPMVPAAFVVLDVLPRIESGKVDRGALPAPRAPRPEVSGAVPWAAPETPPQRALARVWSRVLEIEVVGIDDNFFDLGGDSIRSLQVRSELRDAGYYVTIEAQLRWQTIRELATTLTLSADVGAEELSREPFSMIPPEDRALMPPEVEDAFPLSRTQGGVIFHSQFDDDAPMYRNIFLCRIQGPVDHRKLESSLQVAVDRHPMLRTGFDLDHYGEPLQLVHRRARVPLRSLDLRAWDTAGRARELSRWLDREKASELDWTAPPLVRFFVLRLSSSTFCLALSFFDAVLDGWSAASLAAEILRRYDRRLDLLDSEVDSPETPPPEGLYRDFVTLERRALENTELRDFWRRYLEGAEAATLPHWGASPQGARQVHVLDLEIEASVVEGLEDVAHRAGAALKHALLAAHGAVIAVLAGRPEVITGLEVNARPELPGSERVLGMHMNILPLRLPRQLGFGAQDWVRGTALCLEAERQVLAHRRLPLQEIQKATGRQALVETIFNFTHFHVLRALEGLRHLEVLDAAGFDQTSFVLRADFNRHPRSGAVQLSLVADPGRVPWPHLRSLGDRYHRVFESMARAPEGMVDLAGCLTTAERHQLLVEWNDTARCFGAVLPAARSRWLPDLVLDQARRHPEALAVDAVDGRWSYGELVARGRRLALHLRRQGVGGSISEAPVALALPAGAARVAAVLAVSLAGAPFLPLESDHPRRRLLGILRDSGAELLLTASEPLAAAAIEAGLRVLDPAAPQVSTASQVPAAPEIGAGESPENPPPAVDTALPRADPLAAAYVLYTSGSTGAPKGVVVPHEAVVNLIEAFAQRTGFGPQQQLLSVTTLGFDISILELFLPLATGGAVVLLPEGAAQDGDGLRRRLGEGNIHWFQATPATWRLLLAAGWNGTPGLRALCGGEALDTELAASLLQRTESLWNVYGPTETTVWSTQWPMRRLPESRADSESTVEEGSSRHDIESASASADASASATASPSVSADSTGPSSVSDGSTTVPIGRPLDNTYLLVLDPAGRPALVGVVGEICIGGAGLARGYRADPRRTAAAFVPSPLPDAVGQRLYRTGDLGRLDASGVLNFLGRLDHQLKMSGFRIEPAEVEAQLLRMPELREAAVALRTLGSGRPGLVAYVVPVEEPSPDRAEIRRFLARRLPAYMIPQSFVTMLSLPLTASGKVDRRALPDPRQLSHLRSRVERLLAMVETLSDEEAQQLLEGDNGEDVQG